MEDPESTGKHLWTDEGPNSFKGLYRSDPEVAKYLRFLQDAEEAWARDFGIPQPELASYLSFLEGALQDLGWHVARDKNGGVTPDDD